MTRITAFLAAAIVLIGIALGFGWTMYRTGSDEFASCRRGGVAGGGGDIGGPFTLIDGSGIERRAEEVITRPTLVYFGYTFCPDICPTDLARNALAADALAAEGVDVGQVFVTVDPERDTPEVVAGFADFIHPDLIGLTGDAGAVAEAANAYKVYYNVPEGQDEFYLVDHSSFTYLMDPEAGFLEFYGSDVTPDEVARSVGCYAAAT